MKISKFITKQHGYKVVLCFFILSLFTLSTVYQLFFKNNLPNALQVNTENTKNPTIVIDAGHGGFDGGASSGSVLEKNINLEIAQKLKHYFANNGFHVIMIRDSDSSVADKREEQKATKKKTDMHYRLDTMHENENTIFISIHQNQYGADCRVNGTQVFYSKNTIESKTIANSVQKSVSTLLQPQNKKATVVAKKNLFLLHNAKVPAILVECGFMSNPNELNKLQSEEYQKQLAFSIFSGVVDTLE